MMNPKMKRALYRYNIATAEVEAASSDRETNRLVPGQSKAFREFVEAPVDSIGDVLRKIGVSQDHLCEEEPDTSGSGLLPAIIRDLKRLEKHQRAR